MRGLKRTHVPSSSSSTTSTPLRGTCCANCSPNCQIRSKQSGSLVCKKSIYGVYICRTAFYYTCSQLTYFTVYLFHSLLISYNILLVREAFTHLLRASMISLSPAKYPSTEPPLEAENERFWLLEIYIYTHTTIQKFESSLLCLPRLHLLGQK